METFGIVHQQELVLSTPEYQDRYVEFGQLRINRRQALRVLFEPSCDRPDASRIGLDVIGYLFVIGDVVDVADFVAHVDERGGSGDLEDQTPKAGVDYLVDNAPVVRRSDARTITNGKACYVVRKVCDVGECSGHPNIRPNKVRLLNVELGNEVAQESSLRLQKSCTQPHLHFLQSPAGRMRTD